MASSRRRLVVGACGGGHHSEGTTGKVNRKTKCRTGSCDDSFIMRIEGVNDLLAVHTCRSLKRASADCLRRSRRQSWWKQGSRTSSGEGNYFWMNEHLKKCEMSELEVEMGACALVLAPEVGWLV